MTAQRNMSNIWQLSAIGALCVIHPLWELIGFTMSVMSNVGIIDVTQLPIH
ncbi:hypothetical protein CLV71_13051 [Actinophytocola oryzae]|uniref:Uncharacterized protein n=1 Tax=Actinophytocola oryzae TaxID=502181 RepID=A0A4R7UTU3_9PSEU|nr:hypothetical protein CLV71_13051 [Actinophytocola oryzae]